MAAPTNPWTPAEENRLVRAFTSGDATIAEIAAALGRPTGAVRSRLSKLRREGRVGHKRPPARGRSVTDGQAAATPEA